MNDSLIIIVIVITSRSGTARPMCALCNKVMPVKRIYILNVVVEQEILIKTQENKTGDVLSCCMQQSSIHYKNIKVMTKLPYTQH